MWCPHHPHQVGMTYNLIWCGLPINWWESDKAVLETFECFHKITSSVLKYNQMSLSCFQNETAFHQPNVTLLKTEPVTSCTGISETIPYKDWPQFSSQLLLRWKPRLLLGINGLYQLVTLSIFLSKINQNLQWLPYGHCAVPAFYHTSQQELGIDTDLLSLSLSTPFNALPAPSQRGLTRSGNIYVGNSAFNTVCLYYPTL